MTERIPPKIKVRDLLASFFLPTCLGKCFVLYFGAGFTNHPGEGYGYGLAASIAFSLAMIGRFLWRYRDHVD